MNIQQNTQIRTNDFFQQSKICLFEISDSGTVLYCRNDGSQPSNRTSAELIGRDFYEEVAPFENTEELRPRLNQFLRSDCPTEKFTFASRINNKIVPTKIMLVRISERGGGERSKTIIVDIRKI